MDLDLQQLRKNLCTSLCAEMEVVMRLRKLFSSWGRPSVKFTILGFYPAAGFPPPSTKIWKKGRLSGFSTREIVKIVKK